MAEPPLLDPLPYDSLPQIDPLNPSFSDSFDPLHFPNDFLADLSQPPGLMSDLGFDDIDIDFSVDDLLQLDDQEFLVGDPDSDSKEGSNTVVSFSSPVSGNQGSDLSENMDLPSPESGNCSESGIANEEVKLEEERNSWGLKRKKENEDGNLNPNPNPNPNPRSAKFRRSDPSEEEDDSCMFNAGSEEDDKRKARLMRNRESAQLSRQRKKHYVEELEEKVKAMNSTIADLNSKVSYIMAENVNLRQQLSGSGGNFPPPKAYPPPPPMGPVPFPWIPFSGYALRPQGSQVPLLPIPRLKPQQPTSAPKAKKSGSKKAESKTKKVASVSLLGLLFVVLVFGGLVPGVDLKFGRSRDHKGEFLGQSQGRVLRVSGRLNELNRTDEIGLDGGKIGFGKGGLERVNGRRSQIGMAETEVRQKERGSQPSPNLDGSVLTKNSSESLPALLYVPRNGKHVEINGNLIIHSVLASERAMAQTTSRSESDKAMDSAAKEGKETGLAIAGNVAPALAISKAGRDAERHSNSYGDSLKSTPADGPLQQWFREGLAGPILSSGMCTEVFQFNVSPASANSSGIVPATSVANATGKHPPRSKHTGKIKNRRILYPQPIPLAGSTVNNTEHFEQPSGSSNFPGNKSVSSMVVSVLADPREAGDGDGMISPKSLSRIFVVVLLDSVKYVTYSCVLPLKSSSPHLVN